MPLVEVNGNVFRFANGNFARKMSSSLKAMEQ